MEKKNKKHNNISSRSGYEKNIPNNFIYQKKSKIPTTINERRDSRDQNNLPIVENLPNIEELYISFSNPDNEQQDIYNYNENTNEIKDESKKIKIRKKDLYKIFKMIKIPKEEVAPYILFSFTSIQSEVVSNITKAYKIDYKKLMNLIKNFNIQLGNEDEKIEVDKNSILKIFDLLGLSQNDRLGLMQFFEVDEGNEEDEEENEEEEKEKENENENEQVRDTSLNKRNNKTNKNAINNENNYNPNINPTDENKDENISNKNPEPDKEKKNYKLRKNNKIRKENNNNIEKNNNSNKKKSKSKNKKKGNDKIKEENNNKPENSKKSLKNKSDIKIIEGGINNSGKLVPSSLDQLKKVINDIPSMIKKMKKNNLKGRKKIKANKPEKKKDASTEEINHSNKSKKKSDNKLGKSSNDNSLEKSTNIKNNSKKNNSSKKGRDSPKEKNKCRYSFVLPKPQEVDNGVVYLAGSIPLLGNWNKNTAIPMDEELKNGQIYYTKYLDINKDDFPFEYKYFYIKDDKTTWLGKPKINYKSHPEYSNLYEKMKENENILSLFDLNIRYLNKIDGLNIWDFRKEKLLHVILKYIPDILFFQEITRPQYIYLEENLNSVYENVGIYRDNSDHSEKCSISYNKIKYTLTDWGQFWLSSTPYVPGSNDFGNFFPRICTWALLKQINGEQFLFFNIHLDHANFKAHLRCINVVLNESEKILKKFPNIKMIFLGGCFYCEEDDELILKLKEFGYNEVIFENTFHDFAGDADRHWDYMFWRDINHDESNLIIKFKKSFVLKEDSIIDLNKGQYISDHYPVIAEFEIGNNNTNSDLIDINDDKRDFSEMDEEENLKDSSVFEQNEKNVHDICKDNIKELKTDNKKQVVKYNEKNNNENEENEENEEVEVIEVEEEIEEDIENDKEDSKEEKGDNKEEKESKKNDNKKENEDDEIDGDNEEEIEVEENENEEIKEDNLMENDEEKSDNKRNKNEEIEEEIEVEENEEEEKPEKEEEVNNEEEEIDEQEREEREEREDREDREEEAEEREEVEHEQEEDED